MKFLMLYLTIAWHSFLCFGSENLSVLKDSGICIDDACLKDDADVSSTDSVTTTESLSETPDKVENTTEMIDSTVEVSVTQQLPTKTPVLNVSDKSPEPKPTMPPFMTEFVPTQNFTKERKICFCDLTLNQCDINCCCDRDCTSAHYKVFTKCIDANKDYSNKHCYRSNIFFRNNTSHKIIQDEGGLFCIVRDNSLLKHNYKTRPVLTSLEAFNRSIPKNFYSFSKKNLRRTEFTKRPYKAGLPVWIVQNEEIKPFGVPAPTVGFLCTSEINVKYLVDEVTKCLYKVPESEEECLRSKNKNALVLLDDVRVISNPSVVNESEKFDLAKVCQKGNCIEVVTYTCQSNGTCAQAPKKLTTLGCYNAIPKIQYHIWHNGSVGIKKFEAFIWLKNISKNDRHTLQTTEIKYSWIGTPKKIFERSGNPGYLPGKPIIAGRKVYYATNGTVDKKEAIELSFDPKDWLTIAGSEKGICSSTTRIPINFKENGQYTCSLQLTKDNFGKDECLGLQRRIFKLLVGDDVLNTTTDSPYNKFVATFGNSKVEKTGDWVQVLVDIFPVISSQVGFKRSFNSLTCKHIITDLYVDIAYANIGSFANPQSKILGVSFQFGKHRDVVFYDYIGNESLRSVQEFKLSSVVHFIDLTEPAADAFAEPLELEVKLPHDFFYPFFSRSSKSHYPSTCFLILILLTLVLI